MKLKTLFALLFTLSFAACGATTQMKTVTHPGIAPRIFTRIAVDVRNVDQSENISAEWSFRKILESPDLQVIVASDLFPLGKDYSPEDRQATFLKNGVQALLLVNLRDVNRRDVYHPPTTSTTEVKEKDGKTKIVTKTDPGYTSSYLTQSQDLGLLELPNLKPIWTANATTEVDLDWSNEVNFVNSLAKKTLGKLRKDGFVKTPEKK